MLESHTYHSGMVTLNVLTYNVWFATYAFTQRAQAIFGILRQANADVIALQEVTPRFLHLLFEQSWVANYTVSIHTPEDITDYGNVLLSRLPGSLFEQVKLWSYQERTVTLLHSEFGISVATVHLESKRANQEIRLTQLKEIFLEQNLNFSILMGDCNFALGAPEEAQIPPAFLNTWQYLHAPQDGFTVDTEINKMAAAQISHSKQVQYDRIFALQSMWTPTAIKHLGTSQIHGSDNLWPSDHFGLQATFLQK